MGKLTISKPITKVHQSLKTQSGQETHGLEMRNMIHFLSMLHRPLCLNRAVGSHSMYDQERSITASDWHGFVTSTVSSNMSTKTV